MKMVRTFALVGVRLTFDPGGKRGGGRSLRLPFLARDEKSRGQSAMEKQYRSDLNQCISELRMIVAPSESRGSQSAANATPPLNKVEVLQRACDFLRQSRAKAALFASFPPQSGYVDDGLADRVAEQEARLRSIGALIAQQQATIEQITTQMRSEAVRAPNEGNALLIGLVAAACVEQAAFHTTTCTCVSPRIGKGIDKGRGKGKEIGFVLLYFCPIFAIVSAMFLLVEFTDICDTAKSIVKEEYPI